MPCSTIWSGRGRASARIGSSCDRAPYRPFAGSCANIGVRALAQGPGSIAPSRGANLLRHSAATAMLRGGATLDSIGAVLRHRSPDMTAHYAKVDVTMLQQIAQPWPGDA